MLSRLFRSSPVEGHGGGPDSWALLAAQGCEFAHSTSFRLLGLLCLCPRRGKGARPGLGLATFCPVLSQKSGSAHPLVLFLLLLFLIKGRK